MKRKKYRRLQSPNHASQIYYKSEEPKSREISKLVNILQNKLKRKKKRKEIRSSFYLSLLTYNLFDAFTVDLNAKAWKLSRKSSSLFGRFTWDL